MVTISTDDFPSNPISSQQSGTSIITQLEMLKSKLKVTQYETFQLAAIEALQNGKDTIVVQPTESDKSLSLEKLSHFLIKDKYIGIV